ncbi:hypothetical protein V8C86DRAFT_2493742 [Haematococcus lacustris]
MPPEFRRGPKPTAMLKAKQKAGKSGTPSSSRLRAALTESEKLAKAENQAVSRKRTRFHRLGARYQRQHRRASFFSFSATGKQSKATSLSCHSAALSEDDTELTTSLHVILNGLICPDPVLQRAARATLVKGALHLLQRSNNSLKPRKPTAPNLLPPDVSFNSVDSSDDNSSSGAGTQPAAPGDDAVTSVRTDQQLPGEVPGPSPGAAIVVGLDTQPEGSPARSAGMWGLFGSGLPVGAGAGTGLQQPRANVPGPFGGAGARQPGRGGLSALGASDSGLGTRLLGLGVLSTPGVQLNLRAANALSPWAPISPGGWQAPPPIPYVGAHSGHPPGDQRPLLPLPPTDLYLPNTAHGGLQQPWANMTLEGLGGHANLAMHNNDVALMREVYRVMKTREGAETNRFFKELHSQLRKLR